MQRTTLLLTALAFAGCGGGGGGSTSPSPSPGATQATATISVYNTGGVAAGSFSVAATQVTLNETYLAGHGVATAELDLERCALRSLPTGGSLGGLQARTVYGPLNVVLGIGSYELWCGERRYAAQNQTVVGQGMGTAGLLGRVVEYRLIRPGEQVFWEGELRGTGVECGSDIVLQTIAQFNEASTVSGRQLVVVRLVEDSTRVIGCADVPGAEGWHQPDAVLSVADPTTLVLLTELDESITRTDDLDVIIDGSYQDRIGMISETATGYTPMGASTLRLAEVLSP